jgi:hypothetical protein
MAARQCHSGWGSPEESATGEVAEVALAAAFLATVAAPVGCGGDVGVLRHQGKEGNAGCRSVDAALHGKAELTKKGRWQRCLRENRQALVASNSEVAGGEGNR